MNKVEKLTEIYNDLNDVFDEMYRSGVWRYTFEQVGAALESLSEQIDEVILEEDA